MARFRNSDIQIVDARCPKCSRFVKVQGIIRDVFADSIVAVLAACKRDGAVQVTDYIVWP